MKLYILLILHAILINQIQSTEWQTYLEELNLANGSSNWQYSGTGNWGLSTNCSNFFGDQLKDCIIKRTINNLPSFYQVKVSLVLCVLNNNWGTLSFFVNGQLQAYTYPYKFECILINPPPLLQFQVTSKIQLSTAVWSLKQFKVEYSCKPGCHSCNQNESCICNQPQFINDQDVCGDCSDGFFKFFDVPNNKYFCKRCNSICSKCQGQTEFDCLQCAKDGKLQPTTDGRYYCADCIEQGYYISGDYCKQCDPSCYSCKGPLKSNCTKCRQGYYRTYKQ